MSHILPVPFSAGYVSTGGTGRSAYDLDAGELTKASGAYYRKNDPNSIWKIPGRSLFGTAASSVHGLAVCQFDEGGTDRLLAAISTKVVSASLGTTGTFADLFTGLNASATRLTASHQNDRWYIGNGYDKNKVLQPDGTTRDMGMPTPQLKLTAAPNNTVGIQAFPTANTGSFTNPTFAYDGSGSSTYSSGTLSAAGTVTHTFSGWVASAVAGRSMQVLFSLAGLPLSGDSSEYTGTVGTGGTLDAGYNVTVTLEKSENGGSTWTTFYTTTRTSATAGQLSIGPSVTADNSLLQFRATLRYNSGTAAATLRIYAVYTVYGSAVTPFTTTGSMYYAFTWLNDEEGVAGAPSDVTEVVAFVSQTMVTLTLTETPPADATHWVIYRTTPGATPTIENLGRLAAQPVGETTYIDTFSLDGTNFDDPTLQLTPVLPALQIGDLSIPRDTQPPAFVSMVSWKGSICGISLTNRRALRYSESGRPESFPEFYVVTSFPLDEHDGLIGQMAVGETLVLLCEGAVLALDDLPRSVDGEFNGADARPLKGHPGCVGEYAYSTFSVAGEPRGAWVSPFGVYVTNGQTCACISTDLAWDSEVNVPYLSSAVLRWDAKNLILWFNYDLDGDGLNDTEVPFHMAPFHDKGGNRPKLGQPTEKATSCQVAALIGTTHYRYSSHPSSGAVYIEESTTTGVEMRVKARLLNRDRVNLGVIKATVIHADSGEGETATITGTFLRDDARTARTKSKEFSLYGDRKTTVFMGEAAEAVDFEIVYDGDGDGGILGIQAEIDGQGRSGSANRWVSTSATP